MTQISQGKKQETSIVQSREINEKRPPLLYTAFCSSSMSEEEQEDVNRMLEMMMASKQQLLLRKAFTDEKNQIYLNTMH